MNPHINQLHKIFLLTEEVKLPQSVIDAFNYLAQSQRGEPERAMVNAQHYMGGGVLSFALEHIGDLTHRMSERINWSLGGYWYVKEKVDKVLMYLKDSFNTE